MSSLEWLLLAPCALLMMGFVPSNWANRNCRVYRSAVVCVAAGALIAAILCGVGRLCQGFVSAEISSWALRLSAAGGLGLAIDSLSAILFILISFIGLVITQYAVRYLDGEVSQGRFMRWISFTLGSVMILVLSSNLLLFVAAWIATSFGLHQLLVHYADRPSAVYAARKKFVISRFGDLLLVAAMGLIYWTFGSLEFETIFAEANRLQQDGQVPAQVTLIAVLLVTGAMTKSAQFPFHSWLPETMETPTPVSALMHAGIINAGGFLVIRLSPLISLSPLALDVLALVGAVTALLASVIMLTQTSVKKSLAFSTIAQMGFMMLQCGLGAFSAALLHIVAHSLYKAHAFLSCGSVVEAAARTRRLASVPSATTSWWPLVGATFASVGICWISTSALGVSLDSKPGAAVLVAILVLAITHLLWRAFQTLHMRTMLTGLLSAFTVCILYFSAYLLMDRALSNTVSHSVTTQTWLDMFILGFVVAGCLSVFVLQVAVSNGFSSPLLQRLYVYAAAGFYLDIVAHRWTTRLWRPVQAS